ncbi:hypothetical protein POM88_028868 [Heracleum sosnowskyi]|uniref:Uncharacterized protein n=1 Tax=Heracleum sosnowskyi TaxID=360622 RepID=A0AAD8MED8_9APIA|nr:hypothetical protein POM88_028868 [Heracleum sosnowskyi]
MFESSTFRGVHLGQRPASASADPEKQATVEEEETPRLISLTVKSQLKMLIPIYSVIPNLAVHRQDQYFAGEVVGAACGHADDFRNEANELLRIRDYLFRELSQKTGQPEEKVFSISRWVFFVLVVCKHNVFRASNPRSILEQKMILERVN